MPLGHSQHQEYSSRFSVHLLSDIEIYCLLCVLHCTIQESYIRFLILTVLWYGSVFAISIRVASSALGQSCDHPDTSVAVLKNIRKWVTWWILYKLDIITTTKQSKPNVCACFIRYCYGGATLLAWYAENHLRPLLLTWINFNPSMDK